MKHNADLIVIGGSWGGVQASLRILAELPANYPIPIVLILHRLRNFQSDLPAVYRNKIRLKVQEIEEKVVISSENVYITPSNYHVLMERDGSFSLDVSEYENHSRPSIDVTFTSVAEVYGAGTVGILLSGASRDGSRGLKDIKQHGGIAIVQDPHEAEVDTMPLSAISLMPDCHILTLKEIHEFLLSLQ